MLPDRPRSPTPGATSGPGGGGGSSSSLASAPQQYCLRWNNHQHNLLSVFEDLLHSEAFVDVTLACDGLQLKAHKMVLSACSPYFQSLLYNTPDRHPIVFLRDVRYHEMKALLEFMYRGEVSVDQENLSSLLKVAEGLKIKGLAEVNDTPSPPPPPPPPSFKLHNVHHPFGGGAGGLLSPVVPLAPPAPAASNLDSSSSPLKRISSPPSSSSAASTASSSNAAPAYVGPKRKRAKPRRLSGTEAVPLASGLTDSHNSHQSMQQQPQPQHQRSASVSSAPAEQTDSIKAEEEENNHKLERVSGKNNKCL